MLAPNERRDGLLEPFDVGTLNQLPGFENCGDRALFVLPNPRFC